MKLTAILKKSEHAKDVVVDTKTTKGKNGKPDTTEDIKAPVFNMSFALMDGTKAVGVVHLTEIAQKQRDEFGKELTEYPFILGK